VTAWVQLALKRVRRGLADRVMRLNVVREPRVRSPAQQARAWNNKKEEYQAFLLSYDLVPPPLPWWRA
jgi:hypothetical protein